MSQILSPAETASGVIAHGKAKALLGWKKQLVLGFLAGVYIAFASAGSNMAAFNLLARPETYGLGKCLAGAVFPTGLMLVMLAGGELFTGNTLMGVALIERRITPVMLLRNWGVVYASNFIGAALIAHMFFISGLFSGGDAMLGGVTIRIASYKASLDFLPAFYLGVLCNWLVCLAVWTAWGAESTTGKILAIFFPIWLFITSGFEHCVANMYYVPAGIFAKANTTFASASGLAPEALNALTWRNFFIGNLLPVTLGNIVGGGVFVGTAYWFVYRRSSGRRLAALLPRFKGRRAGA